MELSAYLDGQLPPDVARWVDRAATENPDVARRLHDLRRIRTILRSLEPVSPGSDFVARVIAEAKRRGLMRRVVRERMIQGIIRLTSAAAAVLLIAVVAGVAVQSFMREPMPTGPLSGPGPDAPVVAAAPRPEGAPTAPGSGRTRGRETVFDKDGDGRRRPMDAKPNGNEVIEPTVRGVLAGRKFAYEGEAGKDGHARRKDLGLKFGEDSGEAHTLDLSVADLGAGAKEVEAVLASAGIGRSTGGVDEIAKIAEFDASGSGTVVDTPGVTGIAKPARPAEPDATAPSAKLGLGRLAMFYRAHGDTDELRFIVVAQPDRIAAVTKRLGDLRQRRDFEESSRGLCAGELARPGAGLPKAVSAPVQTSPAAKPSPKSRPATEPYHTAELQRLANNSQAARQTSTGNAPTSQAAQPARPGRELLIITVRLRPPEANRADPMRNTKP